MSEETKFVKAYCSKTNKRFGLEVKNVGGEWKVVNVDNLPDEEAKVLASQVRQASFKTHDTLIPCPVCGNRTLGGCTCPPARIRNACSKDMKYNFECAYCSNFVIDYSLPTGTKGREGEEIEVQGKKVKIVTFSNVTWQKFDNVQSHDDGRTNGYPNEPTVHVIANEQNIEFHGYNISQMDEGVYYLIGRNDDFEIECDVDTSTIRPHPGGCLYISFGAITAQLQLSGGSFVLDGSAVASVGSTFKMLLSLTEGGKYQIYINNIKRAEKFVPVTSDIKVIFGFRHDRHCCSDLSHAYLKNIKMNQGISQ